MTALTFADVTEAMAATVRPVRLYVRIGGLSVDATEAHTRHGVDQLVGTCTVYVRAPRTANIAINAEIEIEAGYAGATRRRFHGFIPNDESITSTSGHMLRIDGVGWASRFGHPERAGIEITGPVSLKDAFRALCRLRSIPTYLSDDTTYVDGTTILLGGNENINGGHIRLDNRTSPATWLQRVPPLFGYRVFDSPDGAVRLARISGLPPASEPVAMHYEQGVNCHSLRKSRDRDPMVTYWEVLGARYTDADGGITQIRSIPDVVPYAAELDPPGYIADTVSSQEIVTAVQAAGVRNALEVDRSEVYEEVSWEAAGHPTLQPGEVVTLTGDMHELSTTPLWLTGIDESTTDRGYIATNMVGWAGAGSALGAGNDCVTVDVPIDGDGVAHLGNQTINWYRSPTSDGITNTINITVVNEDYSSLRLTGIAHGVNTWGTGNIGNPTTGSVIEVWQREDPALAESGTNELKRVGTLDLPTLDEEYARRRDYASSDRYWTAFSLPVSGTLKVGAAELRLISGENPDGQDDYEVTDLQMTYCGIGQPELPGSLA